MSDMVFYSGVIKQNDKKFLINPFEKLVGEPVVLDKEDYVQLTAEAYDFLVNVLDLQHREPMCVISVPADFPEGKIVEKSDMELAEGLLEESDEDKLDFYKEKVLRLANETIANQLMISNFALFHFFKLNHYLASKGYFITDENREEMYLKCINDGDAEVIEKLSQYLDALDEFNSVDETYQKYTEYKDKIKAATSEQEVSEAYYEMSAKL